MNEELTEEVKNYAREVGADLVGIAPVERFKNAPLKISPEGLFPEGKSVIVVGIHHLDCAVELGGFPTPHDKGPYAIQSSAMNPILDNISFKIGRFLEDKGYKTMPVAVTNMWRYRPYKDLDVSFAPDLAHRYAAVAAGLGEIGWSGLFLSPEFGPRQRITSIITEAELVPDPIYNGERLCDRCMECVKHCPTDAFRKEVKKINKIEIGGRIFGFPDTNKWRCAWAGNFGLNLSLPIPEKVDEEVILENLEKYGKRGGEEGMCLKYCMVPGKRYYQLDFTDAPRRKKEIKKGKKEIEKGVLDIIKKEFIDIFAFSSVEKFENSEEFHPQFHLPDAKTVISIGIKVENEIPDLISSINRRLALTAFKIAHLLDISGYSSITSSNIPHLSVGQELTGKIENYYFSTVLTGAELSEIKYTHSVKRKKLEKEDIRKFCIDQGADIVGFFTEKIYENFIRKIKKFLPEKYIEVLDTGPIHGPFIPELKEKEIKIRRIKNYLSEGKSVIAIGLHFPDACLDNAKITPAETVEPYAYAQYETVFLLRDIGLNVVKFLEKYGYKATLTESITSFYSTVKNSRGYIPDMRTGNFEAFLSGAGYIGDNGVLITEKFGPRQRFIFIITDAEFSDDPLYEGKNYCENCSHPCLKSCPTKAIKNSKFEVEIEGKKFSFPEIDYFACDWVKRYCLNGKEGPSYYGVNIDIPVPENKRKEKLVENLRKVKLGVQQLHLNICEECIRNCPIKGKR